MKKIVFAIVCLLTVSAFAQETLLRYNPTEGDEFKVTMKMTQEMGAFMAQTVKSTASLKVVSVTDSSIVNNMKIDRMSMNMIQGENVINYDSSKSEAELDDTGKMMKAQIDPVLSTVITTTQTKLGEVTNFTMEPNVMQAAQIANQNSVAVYPKEAVKVGSTWTEVKEDNGMKISTTYKVEAIESNVVNLLLTGEISGMATGDLSGNISLNKNTGMPVTSKMNMKMTIQGMVSNMVIDIDYQKK